MVLNNPLANVLSTINNSERVAKKSIVVSNDSKLIRRVLDILQDEGYILSYEEFFDGTRGKLLVHLSGSVNKIGVISPNFSCKLSEFQKFEKRFLPAKDFGVLVVSTSQGLMTHLQAKERGIGGRLIAYCY